MPRPAEGTKKGFYFIKMLEHADDWEVLTVDGLQRLCLLNVHFRQSRDVRKEFLKNFQKKKEKFELNSPK